MSSAFTTDTATDMKLEYSIKPTVLKGRMTMIILMMTILILQPNQTNNGGFFNSIFKRNQGTMFYSIIQTKYQFKNIYICIDYNSYRICNSLNVQNKVV